MKESGSNRWPKRASFYYIPALILPLALTSCAPQTRAEAYPLNVQPTVEVDKVPEGWVRHFCDDHFDHHFNILIPDGWEGNCPSFRNRQTGKVVASLSIVPEDGLSNKYLDSYVNSYIDILGKQGFNLEKNFLLSSSHQPIITLNYSLKSDPLPGVITLAFIQGKDKVYQLLAATTKEHQAEYQDTINFAIRSFSSD